MRKAELKVGEEYEITAQPWSGKGYRWRAKSNPGRVKLLSPPSSPGGYYTCQYLENPYSDHPLYDGEGKVRVTARSLIRPWQEVIDEQEERQEAIDSWKQANRDREDEARSLIKEMSWMEAYLMDTLVDADQEGRPADAEVTLEIPLSVLRGIAAQAEKYGAPEPISLANEGSALTEILG